MSKIGICHYRTGKTDGVSLEIEKRAKLLSEMGHVVKLIGGEESIGADFVIPELEFDRPDVAIIKNNAFSELKDFESEDALMKYIDSISEKIERQMLVICEKERFDLLFLHNIFSHGRNIAAAKAFYKLSKQVNTKFIAVDHDFYTSYGDLYKSNHEGVNDFLKMYVPPRDSAIKHVVINSLLCEEIKKNYDLDSIVFPDTMDFDQTKWTQDDFNKEMLADFGIKENDVVILQATRVVERKAIETAIKLAHSVKGRMSELKGKTLYNGKVMDESSDVVLLLPGFVEPASLEYFNKMKNLSMNLGVKLMAVNSMIGSNRMTNTNGDKQYSLWDCYVYADVVTYPSVWEGWGNQFIEAVFAKKPVIVFEYPVFEKDIRNEGYKVISLGNKYKTDNETGLVVVDEEKIEEASDKAVEWLRNLDTNDILETNFKIGNKFHGNRVLVGLLERCLSE